MVKEYDLVLKLIYRKRHS